MVYSESGPDPTKIVETAETERLAFVLDDREMRLARWATIIENHYGGPTDMNGPRTAKDGQSGELYVVQARPETVQARKDASTMRSCSTVR